MEFIEESQVYQCYYWKLLYYTTFFHFLRHNQEERYQSVVVNGLNKQWTKLGQSWKTPVSSSITEARQRLGCQVMSQLFNSIAKPLANPKTPGVFLGRLRVMAIDGTLLDVPDSQANAKVFGYPGSRNREMSSSPKQLTFSIFNSA